MALPSRAAASPQMSEHPSQADDRAAARGAGRIRLRVALPVLAAAAAVGIAAGAALTLFGRSSPASGSSDAAGAAVESWGPGARPAPAFSLRDQNGRPVSLAALHGKPAIITFLDPLCRNVCPLEAQVLNRAVASCPPGERPAVIAISVNRWGNARANLVDDVHRLAARRELALGSRRLRCARRDVAAVRHRRPGDHADDRRRQGARDHPHARRRSSIDGSGHERALFVWPFAGPELEHALASLRSLTARANPWDEGRCSELRRVDTGFRCGARPPARSSSSRPSPLSCLPAPRTFASPAARSPPCRRRRSR